MFVNAKKGQRDDDAGLIYEGFTGSKCLTFWYFMRGSGVGLLEVWVDDDDLLLLDGSQGNVWKKAEVHITGKDSMVSIYKMATGTFTHDSKLTETLKTFIKMQHYIYSQKNEVLIEAGPSLNCSITLYTCQVKVK